MKLLKGLENKGHHVYCDNYYSSPTLFADLRKNGFGACGTLHLNRKGVPNPMKSKAKMTRGQVKSLVKNGTLFVNWMDKRVVSLISTIHSTSRMVQVLRRSRRGDSGRESVQKPECIVDYNKLMGGVDLYDQLCSYYSFDHRTVKWWKRAFFHLLNTAIVNAYILYTQSTQSSRELSHVDFRIEIAKGLLREAGERLLQTPTEPSSRSEHIPEPLRLFGKHFPEKVPPTGSGRPGQLECVVCSKKRGRGKVTTTYRCKTCKKAVCIVPCFELYHTYTDPTRHLEIVD